jgi:ABC-2 type transport system ATP-binding protein
VPAGRGSGRERGEELTAPSTLQREGGGEGTGREPQGVPAVLCRGLTQRFGSKVAVDSLDLTVGQGEVFGLLGPNGAGKTTTIRLINTLLPVKEGRIEVFGFDVSRAPMPARRLMGYVPQMLSVEAALSGFENVMWFARLYDIPRDERKERARDALQVMGLSDAAGRLAGTYSGGMVRRLELAQALVNRPQLLVLDEPTVGLDPIARDGVWERVDEMRRSTGMTVLLTTHYMEEADALCDRVALMHLGKEQAEGPPSELKAALGPNATLEDVFRHFTGGTLEGTEEKGGMREVRSTRRTARRLG